MKKFISALLCAAMLISLVACGESGVQDESDSEPVDDVIQEEQVAVKNPVRSELYDEDDNKLADIAYVYDEKGQKLSEITTWLTFDMVVTESYDYDDNGNVVKKTILYSNSPDFEGIRNYYYDDDNRLVKEDRNSANNYIVYEYDDNGFLAKKYSEINGEQSDVYVYECDENGNVITETTTMGDDWVLKNEYRYNSDGKMTRMVYSVNGDTLLTHNYKYDSDGNLVKRDVSIESIKQEGYVLHFYE